MQLAPLPHAPAMPMVSPTVDLPPSARRAPRAVGAVIANGATVTATATAGSALDQVARRSAMLHAAIGDSPAFYARLVRRGFLEIAIDYARFAATTVERDGRLDGDTLTARIEDEVLGPLLRARRIGTPEEADPALSEALAAAGAAATAIGRDLQSLVTTD